MGYLAAELEKAERRLIQDALSQAKKDAKRAAARLGITLDDLLQRARRLGIPLVVVRRKKKGRATTRRRPGPDESALVRATRNLERRWMREALAAADGDVVVAAASINMNRSLFYRRLKEFGMQAVRGRSPDQPETTPRHRDIVAAVDTLRRRMVDEALRAADGDVTRAAQALGVSRSTLYRMREAFEQAAT